MAHESQLSRLRRLNKLQKIENQDLRETLRAIQSGEVDALVVKGPSGERIFTLQSAEQPYRELVEAMNEGAITVSLDGIILYCNSRFEAMTKVPYGKLVGSDFSSHISPENRKSVQALIKRTSSTPSTIEISLLVADLLSMPVQLSVSTIQLVGAEGFCIIATDLSAQKQSAILSQEQDWLNTLLDLLPVPLVLLETNLRKFIFINAKAREVLSRSFLIGEKQGSLPNRLAFENELGAEIKLSDLLLKIQNGGKINGTETILVTSERKIPVLLFSKILPAMHGREPSKLLMFQDISTIKQAQLDLALALQGRDQFVAALSHELRTPINVILGWVQLLRDNPMNEAIKKQALDTLERNAEMQRDLIENLLDMSRIITGSVLLQMSPLDLKTCVRDCLTSLMPKSEEKGIELKLDILPEAAIVLADDKRIQQLISNLVQNAIKFTPSKGSIVVSVRTDKADKTASVSIKDNGHGIDPAFLPRVFEQFTQENMSTSRAYGGLGLGLAICKTIIDQHSGTLKATSDGLGKGATFTVHLPLSTQLEKRVLHAHAKQQTHSFNGLKILLIDDSQDNLDLFTIWLERNGAEIQKLDSAGGVVAAIDSFNPHILLSDISMPGEDGYALIAKVRALRADQGRDIPAGALTAHAGLEDRDRVLAAGFQLHIPKPVTNGALLEAVKYLVEIGREKKYHPWIQQPEQQVATGPTMHK